MSERVSERASEWSVALEGDGDESIAAMAWREAAFNLHGKQASESEVSQQVSQK